MADIMFARNKNITSQGILPCRTRYLLVIVTLYFLHIKEAYSDDTLDKCNGIVCVNGHCKNDTKSNPVCICHQGWTGAACDSCSGRARYTSENGQIIDGMGNYTLDTKCSWLIEGPPNTTTRLKFSHFETECSWDHLYIYDGNNAFSKLVAVLSGLVLPKGDIKNVIPEITTTSGSTYLHFYSDAAYNMSGFTIDYSMNICPLDCSGHGTCSKDTLSCSCDSGWKGEGCEIQTCPHNCTDNGVCGRSGCISCDPGWRGPACSVPAWKGVWQPVDLTTPGHIGRASARSVQSEGYIWIVSGYDFNLLGFINVLRYDRYGEIKEMSIQGRQQPSPRYGHSLVVYQKHIYMHGGLIEQTITDELWMFNTSNNEWILIDLNLPKKNHIHAEFRAVVGHTAHVIDGIMYVIFGHSPLYGYLNTVQECNMSNYAWKVPHTTGAIVQGSYGHTSVYDPGTRLIYVHGGYRSSSPSAYHLSDVMHSYDPKKRHWRMLHGSGEPKYLHSSVLNDGLILIYGGNTHNDTSTSHGAKCYSSHFMAYDIKCDRWHYLSEPRLHLDISRFGHVAEMYEGNMHVFGGFNGHMLQDMYTYSPGNCEQHRNSEDCLKSLEGGICVWADDNACYSLQVAVEKQTKKIITKFEERQCESEVSDDLCEKANNHNYLLKSCRSCVETSYDCVWCDNQCDSARRCSADKKATTLDQCLANFTKDSSECPYLQNCHACKQNSECNWSKSEKKCIYEGKNRDTTAEDNTAECDDPCYFHNSCENCTSQPCMWCSNENRCVESNSYVASFPYGQCMEWITVKSKCSGTRCSDLRTCEDCQNNPLCGWLDDGSNTGLGMCMEGGADGPLDSTVPGFVEDEEAWYFVECPICQCNGHSTCEQDTSNCIQCEDLTTGPQCQTCQDGYFGTATNGGNCTACECNDEADMCDNESGKCYCRTRGVTGDKCDVCDESMKYYGNPKGSGKGNGTCYYELTTDYQFTFHLNKDDDVHYTRINFFNVPSNSARDVDFTINCSGQAHMNITVKSVTMSQEKPILSGVECKSFKSKFSHREYSLGKEFNTTFFVYLYDFKTPFTLNISFSQYPQIDLVHFFVTFFSCFLSLLFIAFLGWKVKQKYDMCIRRQQMVVQMEQLASRPFAACTLDVKSPPGLIETGTIEPPETRHNKKKKSSKPSPVALEPLLGQKAAVLSLVVQLPTGDDDWTPPSQAGIAVGSALVSLGNTRKNSTEHHQKDKIVLYKNRKHGNPGNPENCV